MIYRGVSVIVAMYRWSDTENQQAICKQKQITETFLLIPQTCLYSYAIVCVGFALSLYFSRIIFSESLSLLKTQLTLGAW